MLVSVILGWHHKIQTVHHERATASTHLKAAKHCYRTTWDSYIKLYACTITNWAASQDTHDKGKGHASPPPPGNSKGCMSPDNGDVKDEMMCEETCDTAQGLGQ